MEISTVYEKSYHIGISDVDFTRKIKLSSLFGYFQDVASIAAEKIGYGIDVLTNQYGVTWALIRIKVDIARYPVWNEDMFIETWPQYPKRFEFERDFIVRDVDGNVIVKATSVWILLDIATRKLRSTETIKTKYPSIKIERAFEDKLGKLKAPGNMKVAYKKVIGYSDIDINEHLNNSRYIDFIMDCFTIGDHKQYEVKTIEVSYVKEALPGDTIILSKDTSLLNMGLIYIEGVDNKDNAIIFKSQVKIGQI